MERVLFIYNPASGEGVIPELLDQMVAMHQKYGYMLEPYRLDFSDRQYGQIVSMLEGKIRHVMVAGGDGTVNYVVNLLKDSGVDIPLAVLPAGTANDFANVLGMPSSPLRACEKILAGEVKQIDLGMVNGRYFVNVFSCGLFTDVSQKTPTIFKNTFGKLAYYVGGLGEMAKFRKMHLEIRSDGGNFEGPSLIFFVFNGRTAGNLRRAYLSEVDDGLLDVLVIRGENPAEALSTVFRYLSSNRKRYPAGVTHLRCSRLTAVSATPEATDIDGQAGPPFPLDIVCCKGALRVIVPKPKPKKR